MPLCRNGTNDPAAFAHASAALYAHCALGGSLVPARNGVSVIGRLPNTESERRTTGMVARGIMREGAHRSAASRFGIFRLYAWLSYMPAVPEQALRLPKPRLSRSRSEPALALAREGRSRTEPRARTRYFGMASRNLCVCDANRARVGSRVRSSAPIGLRLALVRRVDGGGRVRLERVCARLARDEYPKPQPAPDMQTVSAVPVVPRRVADKADRRTPREV